MREVDGPTAKCAEAAIDVAGVVPVADTLEAELVVVEVTKLCEPTALREPTPTVFSVGTGELRAELAVVTAVTDGTIVRGEVIVVTPEAIAVAEV